MSITCAIVNIYIQDNGTFQDALQFGTPGDTSWSLTGMSFEMAVKASRDDTTALTTFTSGSGQIVTDDPINRIINFNVPDSVIQASLPPAEYVYDLIMIDTSVPPVRTPLMQGRFFVKRGVTES